MINNYTLNELLVVNLSKEFKNGEVGFTGLATGKKATLYITAIPLVAMELAKRTHAPDLNIIFAGWIQNPDLSKIDKLPEAEYDETLRDIPCEAQYLTYPYQYSYKRGDISFAFGSGIQVDKVGNINSVSIGNHIKPKVQMVGPIFLPEHFSQFRREYIMMPHHEKRTFVNKVDYIAIGAFFKSFTKNTDYKATISLLKFVKKITKIPIVAIGGINNKNYRKLLLNKANFLAISGYIWNNKKFKPSEAIKKIT